MLESLKLGDQGEQRVIEVFAGHGLECRPNKQEEISRLKKWDLCFPFAESYYFVEVKHDLMAAKTGNVAIEFFNPKSNVPSGITATRSHLWIIVLCGQVWLTNVQLLRQYATVISPLKTVVGGDKNSAMKIYKKEQILPDIFLQIDSLETEAFYTAIERAIKGDTCSAELKKKIDPV